VHRAAQNFREVQQCTLLSIKTGGCSEDCSYCPQSSRYDTGLKAQRLMNKDAVLEAAKKVLSCFFLSHPGSINSRLLVSNCFLSLS
jgi:biotin synthase-like enzyme